MEKKDLITILALLIILILIIVGIWWYCNKDTKNINEEENTIDLLTEEFDEFQEENDAGEELENKEDSEIQVEESNGTEETTTPDIVGKEEQESNQENAGKTDEQKAIDIAKQEWGTEDGVSFDIQNREGNIYTVAVRSTSNTQVYAWYKVNVETGNIEE